MLNKSCLLDDEQEKKDEVASRLSLVSSSLKKILAKEMPALGSRQIKQTQ